MSFLLAFAILTYVGLVIGELVPKAIALRYAERIAMVVARPIDVLQRIAHPLVIDSAGLGQADPAPLRHALGAGRHGRPQRGGAPLDARRG